jgi:hypothetical protein
VEVNFGVDPTSYTNFIVGSTSGELDSRFSTATPSTTSSDA